MPAAIVQFVLCFFLSQLSTTTFCSCRLIGKVYCFKGNIFITVLVTALMNINPL